MLAERLQPRRLGPGFELTLAINEVSRTRS
jgi:hypothetical protein